MKRTFTLIEVLASILIVGIISTASYLSFVVSSRSLQDIRNRSIAINLAQKSEEEIRRMASDIFDQLESFKKDFENFSDESNFPGFSRTLSVSPFEGSSEAKVVEIAIKWKEKGVQRSYTYSFLLSRPPLPLPADICGRVFNATTGEPIDGVEVVITCNEDPSLEYTRTTGNVGCSDVDCSAGGGYTFADIDPDTGQRVFVLNPERCRNWRLTIPETKKYKGYTHPEIIVINSGKETKVEDIFLEPKPQPAYIKGRVIDKSTNERLSSYVSLYRDGKYLGYDFTSSYDFEFEISFDNEEEKCFTLVTGIGDNQWYYSHVYNRHSGDFCDPHGWGKSYNYRGWSSAVMIGGGSCSDWFGSSSTDAICVEPGDEKYVEIPLVDLPLAELYGYIYDDEGKAIKGELLVYQKTYPGGYWKHWYGWGWPKGKGEEYHINVPAEQSLLPDETKYYISMRARGELTVKKCCNVTGRDWSYTGWVSVGPLFKGDTKGVDFHLPSLSSYKCGDAEGYVKDGKTDVGIRNVDIWIQGYGWKYNATDNSGYYEFNCGPGKEDYCSIPVGISRIIAQRSEKDYYPNDSSYYYHYQWWDVGGGKVRAYSRYWYNQSAVPEIKIEENKTIAHSTIYLWPVGYGSIKGRVVKQGGDKPPIEGAKIKLFFVDSSGNSITYLGSRETSTDAEGEFEFENVIETWPPPDLPEIDYYNHTVRKYSITVEKEPFDSETVEPFTLDADEDLDLGDIKLGEGGGV